MAQRRLGFAGCLAAWAAATLVGACGGGGGGGGGGTGAGGNLPTADDYFPLNTGDVWYYDGAGGSVTEVRVTGTRVVSGQTVFVVASTDASGTTEDLYDKASAGVMRVPAPGASAFDIAMAKIPALQGPLVAGESRVPLDQSGVDVGDLDGDGRPDVASLRAEVTVVGFEALSTPAGAWANVAHLRTVITETVSLSGSNRTVTVTGTSDDWYAPNVGPVRSEISVVGPGGSQSDRLTLRAYRAGALRSEAVAPTVAVRSPAANSAVRDFNLSVTFGEAMDRYGLPTDALKLTGPDGQPVPGSVSWQDDRTLVFVPANALVSGAYVASVGAGLRDLVGNALAADPAWSFSLDRQGPLVVSMSPANGAVEVPLDSPIRIVFDEAPDPTSVTAATVRLSDVAGPLPTTLALAGRTLTVTPTQALRRAHNYEVTVHRVSDGLGNVNLIATLATFKTDAGRFAPAQPLGGLALVSRPELIVDINADQRKDLVVLGGVTSPGPAGIFVYRQRADGTLAPPEPVGVQSTCEVDGVMAAHLDNSGRSAIVVSHLCGMEVLRQTADGRLVTATTIDVTPHGVSQMAALRSTARPSIVALPGVLTGPTFLGAPQVWRQDAAGNFAAPVTVATALRAIYLLKVADIDGDGLDDLVLWGLLSSGTAYGVELIMQRADGSFGPSREIAVDHCGGGGNNGIAAGDVNGDGRTDLLLIGNDCNSNDRVALLLQDATGGFAAAAPLASAVNLEGVWLADIDGDGRTDVVTLHGTLGFGIYLQRPDGSLAAEVIYRSPGRGFDLAVGDVTGDGLVDIVSGGYLLRQKPTPAGADGVAPGKRPLGALKALPALATGSARPAPLAGQ